MKEEQSRKIALALLKAVTAEDVNKVMKSEPLFSAPDNWTPYGGRSKNWDTVGSQTSEAVAALGELIINSIDAILVKHAKNEGISEKSKQAPESMIEAVKKFYPYIVEGKISMLSAAQRMKLAEESVLIGVKRAPGSHRYPSYTIVDFGEGQNSGDFPKTFLSLGEKNKEGIPFVQGRFNMGSTGSITFCTRGDIRNKHYKLIMSRRSLEDSDGNWGWTLIRVREAKSGESLPVVEYFSPNGDIPKFYNDKVEAFERGDIAAATVKSGTIVKLYEYDIAPAHNVDLGLYYALTTSLLECALPIRIYDFNAKPRGKTGLRADGITDRTFYGMPLIGFADDETDDNSNKKDDTDDETDDNSGEKDGECNLPTFLVKGMNDPSLGEIEIFATGVSKLPNYMKERTYPYRVFYTVNGQTQAKERGSFLRGANLDDLRAHLIVRVDCNAMNNTARSAVFKPDRERMSGNNLSRELQDIVKSSLKENSELRRYARQIRERRVTEIIEESEQGKELWEHLLNSDPEIGRLFGKGATIGDSPSADGGRGVDEFKGNFFPKSFNVIQPGGDLNVPINTYRYIVCSTDAENEYLGRIKDRGVFLWDGDVRKLTYSHSLLNGRLRIKISPSLETKVGESVRVTFGFNDSSRPIPLTASVTVRFCEEEQTQSSPRGRVGGTGRGTVPIYQTPDIYFVGKDKWDEHGFDDESGAECKYNSDEKRYDIFVNKDNKHLKREMRNEREESGRALISEWFKLAVAILTLAMYKKFIGKTEDDDRWEDNIKQASSAISAYVVTLIQRLGGRR